MMHLNEIQKGVISLSPCVQSWKTGTGWSDSTGVKSERGDAGAKKAMRQKKK